MTTVVKDADKLYLGSLPVDRLYVGANLAWPVAGGFSPADLAGLVCWYDASELALASGAEVTSWPDLSGAGHTLASPTPPTFQTNQQNGLPGVQFDGYDDYLMHLAATPFVTGREVTLLAVVRRGFGTSNGRMFAFNGLGYDSDDYTTPCWCVYQGGGNDRVAPYSNGELALQFPHPEGPFLMTTWFDQTDHYMRINGVPGSTPQFSTAQMGAYAFNTVRVTLSMGWFGGPSSSGNYLFHEVLVYDHALTSTERDQVEAYLRGKWGV